MEIPLKVVLRQEKEGGFRAEVPAMPGVVAEADTLQQLNRKIIEAIKDWFTTGNEKASVLASSDLADSNVSDMAAYISDTVIHIDLESLSQTIERAREDAEDLAAARTAKADAEINGTVSWENIKADLGL